MGNGDLRSVRVKIAVEMEGWIVDQMDRITATTKQSRTSFITTACLAEITRLSGGNPHYGGPRERTRRDSDKLTESEARDFKIFWDLVPRKEGKAAAAKAFKRAVRETGSADRIISGCEAWRNHVHRTKPERRFVKMPSTWLNAGCWEDVLSDDQHIGGPAVAVGPSDRAKREAVDRALAILEVLEERREDQGGYLDESDIETYNRMKRVANSSSVSEGAGIVGKQQRRPT